MKYLLIIIGLLLAASGYSQNSFFMSHNTAATAIPTLTTNAVTSVTNNSAVSGGNVTLDGGATITERGICWKAGGTPTTADSKQTASGTTGSFSANLSSLSSSTLYYVRSYAINSVGTAYGSNTQSFTTSSAGTKPTVAGMTYAWDKTGTTATTGGTVVSEGSSAVTERGVCWGLSYEPDITGPHDHYSTGGSGEFYGYMTGLSPCQRYYARMYATNSAGTAYGIDISFMTTRPDAATYNWFLGYSNGWGVFRATCENAASAWAYEHTYTGPSDSYTTSGTLTVGLRLYIWGLCDSYPDGWYLICPNGLPPTFASTKRIHMVNMIITAVEDPASGCASIE